MKISIIIPVYRNVSFLPDCLDSIVTSSPEEIEVIIVDDEIQNKEELYHVVKKRENELLIRIVQLEGMHGVAAARNKGVQVARGKYLLFLDDDDYLVPGAVETYLQMIKGQDVIAFEMEKCRIGRQAYLMEIEKDGVENEESREEEGDFKLGKEARSLAASKLVKEREKLSHISILNIS